MMKPEWIYLPTDMIPNALSMDYAMNVPGGMILRTARIVECKNERQPNSDTCTFVPLVNVVTQNGQVGFVSVMAEAMQMSVASSMAAVDSLLSR